MAVNPFPSSPRMREMSGGFRDDLPPGGEALTEAALEAKFKQLLLPWLIALAALMVTLVFLGTALGVAVLTAEPTESDCRQEESDTGADRLAHAPADAPSAPSARHAQGAVAHPGAPGASQETRARVEDGALDADGACTLSRHSSAETVKRCLAAYKKAQAL